ncbi:hypothetical protein ACNQR7_30260 [Mycolicibacterium senegalense]|uniref:hypothetical protein n=1 Tax=Mycolicibacterium senegalense TaxID=1796 RepID=UPI003AAE8AE5
MTAGAVGTVLLAVGGFTFGVVKNVISATFVDVVRYLDTSPRSYSARRAIRGGMVALLRELHDADYDRIVVVAHSLGGYIAYDALMSLWAENHQIHSGLPAGASETLPVPLAGLDELESAAAALMRSAASDPAADVAEATDPDCVEPDCRRACQHEARRGLVRDYQQRQFALWEGLRAQGNPWRVTDFVTVGTPMYFADILITQPPLRSGFRAPTRSTASAQPRKVTSRTLFDDMIRRGQLVTCPPRSETSIVEAINPAMPPSYRWTNGSRQILGSQSIFAVTRWTNLWFPTRRGHLAGDWFGGRLAPLFGPGVRDIRICGNRRWRFAWALAHSRYFDHPDEAKPADLAGALHAIFNFTGIHANLQRIADREQVTDPAPTQAAAGHSAHAAPPQPPADDAGQ